MSYQIYDVLPIINLTIVYIIIECGLLTLNRRRFLTDTLKIHFQVIVAYACD